MRLRLATVVVLSGLYADPASAQTPSGSPRLICFGNEPNWSVAFTTADQARVTAPNAEAAVYRGRETRLEPLRERVWRGSRAGQRGDLVLLMREAACSDGMSDMTHPIVARLSLADGSFLAGCCRVPAPEGDTATLEGPTWQLAALPGQKAADLAALPRRPSLRLAEGRATGFGGCNNLTGSYTAKGSSVTFKLASTMMACPEPAMGIERAFLQALNDPVTAAFKGDHLTLTSGSGTVLEFEPAPVMTLSGRTWSVTQFNNGRQAVVSLLPDTQLLMTFENGKVTGQAGCNAFNATYTTKGDAITISHPATTRKMCAEAVMTQERQFLAALQSASKWTIDGGELDVHRPDGERVLSAKPSGAK